MYSLQHFTYNKIRQYSRNKLLKSNDAVDGLATSHGSSEGYALMLSGKQDKMRLTSVLFGGSSADARDKESEKLINYGFRFFETYRLYTAFEPISKIRVWKGDISDLPVGLTQDLYITIPKGQYQKLDARMQVGADLMAPVKRGQKLGYVMITLGKKNYARKSLVSLMDVHDGNFWHNLLDAILMPFN
jgi:D-alanyl-D-alanine carboxypeptidase (penicillin-binding protein 5/6)